MRRGAGLLLASLLVLGGCQTSVGTNISIKDPEDASMEAVITFHDEAADAVLEDVELEDQLRNVLAERTTQEVRRSSKGSTLTYKADLPYSRLGEASGILGVSGAALRADGDDATLSVTLSKPQELIEAIKQSNASEADAEVLTETILKTTTMVLEVHFPGDIKEVQGPAAGKFEGATYTLEMPLDSFEEGVVTVTGSTVKPFITKERLISAAVVVALLGVVLFWWRKRQVGEEEL